MRPIRTGLLLLALACVGCDDCSGGQCAGPQGPIGPSACDPVEHVHSVDADRSDDDGL